MSSFLIDTMVEASNTDLQSHTPDTGGAWKKISGFWNARVTGGAGYAETYNYDGDQARYASDTTPPSADWGIRASHKFIGTPGYDPFLILYCRDDLRSAATAEWYTSYEFKVSKSGAWTLGWRDGSDVYTSISTGSVSALGNTDHTFELDAVGTTITAKIDGSTVYTGTDTNVSIVGVASIRWADGQLNWIQAGNPADPDPGGTSDAILTAAQGSLSLTGQAASLLVSRVLSAAQGSYSLTGQNATLTYEQPGVYTLTANHGSYTITGSDGLAQRAMNAGFGSYALSGQDVGFTLTVPNDYVLTAAQGNYTISGKSARLQWSGEPPVIPRSFGIVMGIRIGL